MKPAAFRCTCWRALCSALILAGCARTAQNTQEPETLPLDPALEAHVLDSVPSDIENRLFVDFEGKVHLIGYAIQPKTTASPGSRFKLTLYWRSVAKLGPEWALFTHLLDGTGRKFGNTDNEGPLRRLKPSADGQQTQTLPPSLCTPGKIYVDEQEIEVPREVDTPELTIAVGVWREQRFIMQSADGGIDLQNPMRLAVISGPSDGKQRAIVAHLKTGIVRPIDVAAKPSHP
jgi:hypothetical protein